MKKSGGVPLSFPKFTEGGVPNSEKEGSKGNKKGERGQEDRGGNVSFVHQ